MSAVSSAPASIDATQTRRGVSPTVGLLLWLSLCVGGGALLGVASAGGESGWYQALEKPGWTPPSGVFAPVWTALYALMATAAWRIWRNGGWREHAAALNLFLVQLALNFTWSPLFFNLQQIDAALIDIIALWLLIAATIGVFARVDRVAAFLLVPYLAWVSYATALNWTLASLN